MGGAIVAMAAMITGFLTNIFLDYLFVWIFPWGMMGAAVATAIGQAMTFLVCVGFFIAKRQVPSLPCGKKILALSRRILSVGLSPFGLTFSPNITLILINKSAAIVGGNLAVTCYAPISYICSIIILLMQGVSDGSQPLISLTYGEGKLGLTRTYRNMAYRFSLVVAAVCMAVLFFLRDIRRFSLAHPGDQPAVHRFSRFSWEDSVHQYFPGIHRLFLRHPEKSVGLHSDLWRASLSVPASALCAVRCRRHPGYLDLDSSVTGHRGSDQCVSDPPGQRPESPCKITGSMLLFSVFLLRDFLQFGQSLRKLSGSDGGMCFQHTSPVISQALPQATAPLTDDDRLSADLFDFLTELFQPLLKPGILSLRSLQKLQPCPDSLQQFTQIFPALQLFGFSVILGPANASIASRRPCIRSISSRTLVIFSSIARRSKAALKDSAISAVT